MNTNLKIVVKVGFIVFLALMSSCDYSYRVSSIEGGRVAMTDVYDKHVGDQEVLGILSKYKSGLDSIMSPVVGHAAEDLSPYRPESPMSNLMADLLLRSCKQATGKTADVAIMNMGGIRNSFTKGPITYGTIFEISPFENTLCVLEMDGRVMQELFNQIAAVHGEGISGAKLEITKDGQLLSATIGGKPIDPNKVYLVSTLDYVAEGNDKMPAFLKAKSKVFPEDATLRNLLMNYVMDCEKNGILVDAKVEGRIVVK